MTTIGCPRPKSSRENPNQLARHATLTWCSTNLHQMNGHEWLNATPGSVTTVFFSASRAQRGPQGFESSDHRTRSGAHVMGG